MIIEFWGSIKFRILILFLLTDKLAFFKKKNSKVKLFKVEKIKSFKNKEKK